MCGIGFVMKGKIYMNDNRLRNVALDMRRIVLERSYYAGVGHIGSALSVVDILAVLYTSVLNIEAPSDRNRDRFILSKEKIWIISILYAFYNQ